MWKKVGDNFALEDLGHSIFYLERFACMFDLIEIILHLFSFRQIRALRVILYRHQVKINFVVRETQQEVCTPDVLQLYVQVFHQNRLPFGQHLGHCIANVQGFFFQFKQHLKRIMIFCLRGQIYQKFKKKYLTPVTLTESYI